MSALRCRSWLSCWCLCLQLCFASSRSRPREPFHRCNRLAPSCSRHGAQNAFSPLSIAHSSFTFISTSMPWGGVHCSMMPNLRGCVCSEEAAAFHAEKHSRRADFTALMTSAVCCVVFIETQLPSVVFGFASSSAGRLRLGLVAALVLCLIRCPATSLPSSCGGLLTRSVHTSSLNVGLVLVLLSILSVVAVGEDLDVVVC